MRYPARRGSVPGPAGRHVCPGAGFWFQASGREVWGGAEVGDPVPVLMLLVNGLLVDFGGGQLTGWRPDYAVPCQPAIGRGRTAEFGEQVVGSGPVGWILGEAALYQRSELCGDAAGRGGAVDHPVQQRRGRARTERGLACRRER